MCLKKNLIESISATAASAVSLAAVASTGEPLSIATFLPTVSPLIQDLFSKGLNYITNARSLSKKECDRLGISYKIAVEGINKKIQEGAKIRSDEFFIKYGEHSKASELLEAAIKSTIDDTELKKSIFYGRFMQNIPFENEYSGSTLVLINGIIKQLTYTDMCIIKFAFDKASTIDADSINGYVKTHSDINAIAALNYLVHLQSLGILFKEPPVGMLAIIGNLSLSYLGKSLYNMLELNQIPDEDMVEIRDIFHRVGVK